MTLIKADFHLHTHFSPDSLTHPQTLVKACCQRGLGLVAVTDHDTISGALAVRAIAPFPVIVAEEIETSQGEIIGLFLREEIPPRLSPQETVGRIKEQGGLVYIPHPFDGIRGSTIRRSALEAIVAQIDVVEVFNARILRHGDQTQARQFAQTHGLLAAAGSDAHTPWEVGRCYVELPDLEELTPDGLKKALARGRVVGKTSGAWVHGVSKGYYWGKKVVKLFQRALERK